MNNVLRNVLGLIHNNIGAEDAPWMNRIACKCTKQYLSYCLSSCGYSTKLQTFFYLNR